MIVSIVLVPLIEEAVIRLFVFDVVLLRSVGLRIGPAIVLQSLFFVWWESPESLVRAVFVFLAGVLLGGVYFKRGLRWSIATHAAINLLIVTSNWVFSS